MVCALSSAMSKAEGGRRNGNSRYLLDRKDFDVTIRYNCLTVVSLGRSSTREGDEVQVLLGTLRAWSGVVSLYCERGYGKSQWGGCSAF
jgi:hypothetical protein